MLQDVGGVRRVPGEQQEVSTYTACLFKLLVVFPATRHVVLTSDSMKSTSFLIITLPFEWLKLDVMLGCYKEYSESKYR